MSGSGAFSLVPGRVYALGGTVAVDGGCVSWVPPTASGYQAVNAYLLLEGDRALLIDTGLPVHRDAVLDQLREVLPAHTELSIFITRSELDSLGNVGAVCAAFDVAHLYTGGVVNPFDGLDQLTALSGERSHRETRLTRLAGETIPLGAARTVEIMPAPISMLTAFWVHDPATGTLFSSDLFGGHLSPSSAYEPGADPDDRSQRPEDFDAFVNSRYWWLEGSDTPALGERLDAVFEGREVVRIAPAHGRAVTGAALAEQRRLMAELLEKAGRRRVGAGA